MVVDAHEWPAGTTFEPTVLENGDLCHREADGVGNKALQRLFKSRDWHGFKICDAGGARDLTDADVEDFGS